MCFVTGVSVTLPVHIGCNPPVGIESELAEYITASPTAVNKCAPIVERLRQSYQQTSVKSEKFRIEYEIRKVYSTVLEGVAPWDLIPKLAKMLTKTTLGNIRLRRAEVSSSMILYCEVSTVEALLYLQQMIDSGELSELFSSMLSLLANTDVTATVSLSLQEYDAAFALLNSAAGKDHLVIVFIYKHCCVLSNSGLSNATSKWSKFVEKRGNYCRNTAKIGIRTCFSNFVISGKELHP